MSVRQTFVATVLIAVYAGARASIPDCASKCFQTAVNDHACDQWLSDVDCCRSDAFILLIYNCIYDECSRQPFDEAWSHLREECDKVDVYIPPAHFVPLPEPTSTSSTETTSSTTTTSRSSTSTASVPITTSTTASAAASTTETPPTEPLTTGTTTTGPKANTIPSGSDASNDDNGSGGLNSSTKVVIIVPLVLVALAIALFFFLRRRRKKATPSSTEAPNNAAHENKPLVHEISGTEISGGSRYRYAAELEAVEASRAGGTTLPPPNSTMTPYIAGMDSHTNLTGRPQRVGNQAAASASHTSVVINHQPNDPRTSGTPAPAAIPLAYSPPTTSPVSGSSPPVSPIQPQGTSNFSSQQMSMIEPSLNVSLEESREIQRLLASLEAVERRKRESASRAQMLEREEAAVRAEEKALLEEIRKRTGKLSHGSVSPRPGPV
ncbi:hypothetical protein BDBG_04861 [Blastomyces gilchristii SLH14081]|uniref:CFEM domain-containing protein n=1 Tax=Blastomyces gilchristii (strain SLH14081) TaxID=559298 RepID=A0A179UNJ2_BLAGS|nr:uncharacterized protein BDBG_04861 [Blastomyces gilchristii SLH14081]OAT08601.1 hypothetical protein BDBG_04861 [Blastomyces gilchristii SLH14081]